MKKKIAVIFGCNGGIGSATKDQFVKNGYQIIPVNQTIIDFNKANADQQIISLLTNAQPDVVINCAGVFINGSNESHLNTMNVNFGSNWSITRYYMNNKDQDKPTKIIMVGSSSYREGKKLYPLYSASKSALFNMWQGASDYFEGSMVTISLINPVRTLTNMTKDQFDPSLDYLEPQSVAEEIFKLADIDAVSSCVDMTFKETK
jgi:short-subunit dehydrogenase